MVTRTLVSSGGGLKRHLRASDFPATTNDLHIWEMSGTSDFDGSPAFGSESLTENGTGYQSSGNHLGESVYNFAPADSYLSNSAAIFDSTGSFTVGAWFNLDESSLGTYRGFFSKLSATISAYSFQTLLNTTRDILTFAVMYNASGSQVTIDLQHFGERFFDKKWHHVVFTYDQANTSMSIYFDGRCVGHKVDANLAARNNSSGSDLVLGACTFGDGSVQEWRGEISDIFYQNAALSQNEIREIYKVGAQRLYYVDPNGLLRFAGESDLGEHTIHLQTTYTMTGSMALATGLQAFAWEDGVYQAEIDIHTADIMNDGSSALVGHDGQIRFNGVNKIQGQWRTFLQGSPTGSNLVLRSNPSRQVEAYAGKNQEIAVYAQKIYGVTSFIQAHPGEPTSSKFRVRRLA